MRNYRGWLRVGVVLSATWLSLCVGYLAFHHHKESEGFARTVWETRNEGQLAVVGQESFLLRCESKRLVRPVESWSQFLAEAEPSCTINQRNSVLVLLLPLAIGWIVATLLIWAVLWVRAGFKRP